MGTEKLLMNGVECDDCPGFGNYYEGGWAGGGGAVSDDGGWS